MTVAPFRSIDMKGIIPPWAQAEYGIIFTNRWSVYIMKIQHKSNRFKSTRGDYFEAGGTQAANNRVAARFDQRADPGKRVLLHHDEGHHGKIGIIEGGYFPLREK